MVILKGLITSAIFLPLFYWLGFSIYESSSITFFIFYFFYFLENFGRKINILDGVAFVAIIQYLLMSVLTYRLFDENSELGKLWQSFMPIDSNAYFSYTFPGTVLFVIGLNFPVLWHKRMSDETYLIRAKEYLQDKSHVGYMLIAIGLIATVLVRISPKVIQGIIQYFAQLTFVGAFYLIHSKIKSKGIVIGFVILLLLVQCVLTGMYGELIFWTFLGCLILMVGKKNFSFSKKMMVACSGIFLILLIQSVKHEYRMETWDGRSKESRGSDSNLMGKLIVERLTNPASIIEPERMFGMVVRSNQGFLIARTMDYVPKQAPYANGETIYMAVAAAFVPRIFWANKPMSGGAEMICRFLGDCDTLDYSYDIGQIGEAYANFGRVGGIIFMFFYGLFMKWSFSKIFVIATNTPTLVLWLPMLFYSALSLETDVLTFINSFIKGVFFCWFTYFSFRIFFKIKI